MYKEIKEKIIAELNITEKGTDVTHDLKLTFDELTYILGGLNICHDLIQDVREKEPTATKWFIETRPKTRRARKHEDDG